MYNENYNIQLDQSKLYPEVPLSLQQEIDSPHSSLLRFHHLRYYFMIAAKLYNTSTVHREIRASTFVSSFMADDLEAQEYLIGQFLTEQVSLANRLSSRDEYFAQGSDIDDSPFRQGLERVITDFFDPAIERFTIGRLIDPICGGCPIQQAHCYTLTDIEDDQDTTVESFFPEFLAGIDNVVTIPTSLRGGTKTTIYTIPKYELKRAILYHAFATDSNIHELAASGITLPKIKFQVTATMEANVVDIDACKKLGIGYKEWLRIVDAGDISGDFVFNPRAILGIADPEVVDAVNKILQLRLGF